MGVRYRCTYYKCNMTDVLASLGIVQLKRYPELLKKRRIIIEKYDKGLKNLPVHTMVHYGNDFASSGHLYCTRALGCDRIQTNQIMKQMAERGINTNVHYKPLPLLTAYKNLGFRIEDYPNAYAMYENELTLPLHSKLTEEEVDYVIENYRNILESY